MCVAANVFATVTKAIHDVMATVRSTGYVCGVGVGGVGGCGGGAVRCGSVRWGGKGRGGKGRGDSLRGVCGGRKGICRITVWPEGQEPTSERIHQFSQGEHVAGEVKDLYTQTLIDSQAVPDLLNLISNEFSAQAAKDVASTICRCGVPAASWEPL